MTILFRILLQLELGNTKGKQNFEKDRVFKGGFREDGHLW